MQEETATRPLRAEDYDEIIQLWRSCEGVEIAEGDDRATIAAYLERNQGLSRAAVRAGRIVGAVLCGHDGRRGLLYHLAVANECRSQGIGRKLVSDCIGGLKVCGIQRALILVERDNASGFAFWHSLGFEDVAGALPLGIDL